MSAEQVALVQAEVQRLIPELTTMLRGAITAEIQANPGVAATNTGSGLKPAKPNRFRGDKVDLQEVTVWLFGLESFFAASNVSGEGERVTFAAAMLEGPAQTWWMTVMHGATNGSGQIAPSTWAGFGAALKQRFQPINAERAARDRLHSLRQVTTVNSYATDFQQLLLKCPDISGVDQLHRFIHGLKPQVQQAILLADPQDLSTAISMAERVDTITFRISNRTNYTSNSTPMELGALQEEQFETGDEEGEAEPQLAALHQRGKPNGSPRVGNPWEQQRAQQGGSGRPRDGSPWPRRSQQEMAERRRVCETHNLCRRCMRPGHTVTECEFRYRLNVNAPPV